MEELIVKAFTKNSSSKRRCNESCEWVSYVSKFTDIDHDCLDIDNGFNKKWYEFKREYDLHENSHFHLVQLIDYSRKIEICH